MTREDLGTHEELKGMGGNNKLYGGSMEIIMNGTLTKELCVSSFKDFGKIKVRSC